MNEVLKFLNSHASVRKFTGKEISQQQEIEIITTAQRSPTSSNLQAYSIVGVRTKQTKDRLAHLTGDQKHINESSLFLIFLADLNRLARLNAKRDYPFTGEYTELFLIAAIDATLAASRALMAAQSMGLGGVMVGGIRNHPREVSELLNLPRLVAPVMGMSLGYPLAEAKIKPRLPTAAVYFREKYRADDSDSLINEYDATITKFGYLKGRKISPDDYPDFQGEYSWSEHTARRMASTEPGTLRPHMKEFLNEKGFLLK